MVHINDEGELLEIGGDLLDLAGDIGCLIATVSTEAIDGGFNRADLEEYIATILKTVIDVVEDREVREGIIGACRAVSEFSEVDKRFRIYRKAGKREG